jgi:hypothetical protein
MEVKMSVSIKKKKIWVIPCPGVGLRAVSFEYWWKKILLARKIIYKDLNNTCGACWFNSNEEILFRGNL